MTITREIIPRIEYNRKVADKWCADHKIADTVPRVTRQIETAPLNLQSLHPFAYNPSLIRVGEQVWMSYRYHPEKYTSKTVLAQLEPHGTAVSKVLLTTTGLNIEDARLFQFNKQPHISWVVSDFVGQASVHSIVRYGQLTNDMKVTELHTHQPDYGNNDWSTMQKNWVFFEYDGELFCIYDSWPQQVILQITNGVKIFLEHRSAGVRWPWGKIKGGATPLPYEDGLLRFFHSRLDNEEKPCPFRYYVGALVMEKIPPFKVLRVSKQPILRGSMEDDLSPKQIAACQHYKGRVVFPAGALETKDGWVLSVGVNDAACVMCKIREKDLNL